MVLWPEFGTNQCMEMIAYLPKVDYKSSGELKSGEILKFDEEGKGYIPNRDESLFECHGLGISNVKYMLPFFRVCKNNKRYK